MRAVRVLLRMLLTHSVQPKCSRPPRQPHRFEARGIPPEAAGLVGQCADRNRSMLLGSHKRIWSMRLHRRQGGGQWEADNGVDIAERCSACMLLLPVCGVVTRVTVRRRYLSDSKRKISQLQEVIRTRTRGQTHRRRAYTGRR